MAKKDTAAAAQAALGPSESVLLSHHTQDQALRLPKYSSDTRFCSVEQYVAHDDNMNVEALANNNDASIHLFM